MRDDASNLHGTGRLACHHRSQHHRQRLLRAPENLRCHKRVWKSPETVGKLFSSLKFPNFSQAGERWKPQSEHPRIRPDAVHGKSKKKQKYNPTAQKNNCGRQLAVNPGTPGSSFASTPRFSTFSPPEARDKVREWPPGQNCSF